MIPFTQYLRPNGKRITTQFAAPREIEAKARSIIAAGYVFEIEELMNGLISMTIGDGEQDIAHELCKNTSDTVRAAVIKLVTDFDLAKVPQ